MSFDDPTYIFGSFLVVIVFYKLYQTSVHDQAFVLLCFGAVLLFFIFQSRKHTLQVNAAQKSIKLPVPQGEVSTPVYQVYKHPSGWKYSYRVETYRSLMDSLEFTNKYDVGKLNEVKAYCEAFFKTHFNIMVGKYDPQLYIDQLIDYKRLALRTMHELVFVLPKQSTIVDIPDLDEHISKCTLRLTNLLTKYINVVHHAHKTNKQFKTRFNEPPYPFDYADSVE